MIREIDGIFVNLDLIFNLDLCYVDEKKETTEFKIIFIHNYDTFKIGKTIYKTEKEAKERIREIIKMQEKR